MPDRETDNWTMKPIAVNSLFRWINSLFGRKKFRVPNRTGNLPQHIGIAERIDGSLAEKGSKMAGIRKIPCYFPCWQGTRGFRVPWSAPLKRASVARMDRSDIRDLSPRGPGFR